MPYPDDFRRRTEQNAAFGEIGILGDDDMPVFPCMVPDRIVHRAVKTERLYVRRARIEIREQVNEPGRKILVEKQLHAFDTSWCRSRSAA